MAGALPPSVVEHVRAAVAEARQSEVSLPERALGTTARILIDRLEVTQRELATTRRALAKETDIATRDPLTGLLNREGLERWLGGPESDGLPMPPMGVVLIDLDGFKQINDSLGHLVGDQLLCAIADALQATTRPGDVAARWGGDEFVVLCPDAANDELSAIADRLIGAIAQVDVNGARVSASAGIKTCSVHGSTRAWQLRSRAECSRWTSESRDARLPCTYQTQRRYAMPSSARPPWSTT